MKKTFLTTLTVVIVATTTSQAFAVSSSVRNACMGDYLSYCSAHSPSSPGVRRCMRANGSKLSRRCVNALVKAGYVSKTQNAPQLGFARPLRQNFQVNDGRRAHAARRFALPISAYQAHI